MTSYFARLVDFVGAHPQLSFVAVFLLALSEAVPVIGTVVPGSTLILAISALATTAGITPWALLGAAVAGAIVGDGFSFWLGHRYHRQILRLAPQSLSPGDRAQRTIDREIWRRQRVPRALHSSCARLCPLGGRHSENVITPVLFGQYPVGAGLGANACFPWSVGRPSNRARRCARTRTYARSRGRTDIGLDRLEHDQA